MSTKRNATAPVMKMASAEEAIRAILASIPDSELPKPDKTEQDGETTVAWFSSHGYHLGSAQRRTPGGKWKRNPENYRDSAIREAVENEAVYRLDLKYLKDTK